MRVTFYALTAIILSVWTTDIGRAAPRSLINKKTSAAIGLTHSNAAKGGQAHSFAPKSAKPESLRETGGTPPPAATNAASANGAVITRSANLSLVPLPNSASRPSPAGKQNVAAFAHPMISPPPVSQRQFSPAANVRGIGGAAMNRPPFTPGHIGGVASASKIGVLDGATFHPRRR